MVFTSNYHYVYIRFPIRLCGARNGHYILSRHVSLHQNAFCCWLDLSGEINSIASWEIIVLLSKFVIVYSALCRYFVHFLYVFDAFSVAVERHHSGLPLNPPLCPEESRKVDTQIPHVKEDSIIKSLTVLPPVSKGSTFATVDALYAPSLLGVWTDSVTLVASEPCPRGG